MSIPTVTGEANDYGYIVPKSQVQYTGDTAVFQCMSSREPKWTKSGSTVLRGVKIRGHYIHITNVKQRSAGTYICRGYNGKQPFIANSTLYVGGTTVSVIRNSNIVRTKYIKCLM